MELSRRRFLFTCAAGASTAGSWSWAFVASQGIANPLAS